MMGGALGVATGQDSVVFFSKTKLKKEKGYFFNVAYCDLVVPTQGLKPSDR